MTTKIKKAIFIFNLRSFSMVYINMQLLRGASPTTCVCFHTNLWFRVRVPRTSVSQFILL
jgi:hypothetical protein